MNFTTIQNVLWAVGSVAIIALLLVLIKKRRWGEFPAFTAWIAFLTAESIGMFVIYREGSARLYSVVYWLTVILDFFLQIGVVVEIARIVLRPTGTWLYDARTRFLISGIVATVVAAGTTLLVHPYAQSSLDVWEIRLNLFTGIIIVELFSAMMGAANRLGLQWGSHVMGLGQGLFAWSAVAVLVDALHNLLGRYRWFTTLDELRGIVWIGSLIYWTVIFWRPQRERKPLSPDMQKYLVDLHNRVSVGSFQPAIVLCVVMVVIFGRYCYRNITARRLFDCDWNDLFGKLEIVPGVAVAQMGEEYLNPRPNQIATEPLDIWLGLGGMEGLRRMRRNAGILIALAAYAERWNFTESVIVRERMRHDALQLRVATLQITLRMLLHTGRVRVPFHLHQSVAAYHLMTRRLLMLYQTSHAGLYPRLAEVLSAGSPQNVADSVAI
jgi:hypothetical protein